MGRGRPRTSGPSSIHPSDAELADEGAGVRIDLDKDRMAEAARNLHDIVAAHENRIAEPAVMMRPQGREDAIAVHDAARPLVSQGLIGRVLSAAFEHGAAAAALPVHLTIKQAIGPLPAPVQRTLPRHQLWAMQTPQIMRQSDLLEAFDACPIPLSEVTDDVQLLELAGKPVWLVEGEERNLKITTAMDLQMAESLVK